MHTPEQAVRVAWNVTVHAAWINHSPSKLGVICFHMMSQRNKHAESIANFQGPMPVVHDMGAQTLM